MIQTPTLIAVVPLIPILIAIVILAALGAVVVVYSKSMGVVGEVMNGPVGYALAAVVLVLSISAIWKAGRAKSPSSSPESPGSTDSGTGKEP